MIPAFNASDPHSVKQPEISLCPRPLRPRLFFLNVSWYPAAAGSSSSRVSAPLVPRCRSAKYVGAFADGGAKKYCYSAAEDAPRSYEWRISRDMNANTMSSRWIFLSRSRNAEYLNGARADWWLRLEFIAWRNTRLSKSRDVSYTTLHFRARFI